MTARVRKVEAYVVDDPRDMLSDCTHHDSEESAYETLALAIMYKHYSGYHNMLPPHRVLKQNDWEFRGHLARRLARFLAFADSKRWETKNG